MAKKCLAAAGISDWHGSVRRKEGYESSAMPDRSGGQPRDRHGKQALSADRGAG